MVINPIQIFYSLFEEPEENTKPIPPWKLALYSAALAALATFSIMRAAYRISWKTVGKKVTNLVPSIDKKLVEDMLKIERELEEKCLQNEHPGEVFLEIPREGIAKEQILKRFQNKSALPVQNIQLDGQVDLIQKVNKFVLSRLVVDKQDAFLIPNLEKELIRMFRYLLNGDVYTCGNITHDSTASIRHALFSAREAAKKRGLHQEWEMIIPESAHPAFEQVAKEYGIALVKLPIYPGDHPKAFQANIENIKGLINQKTILIALSSPNQPFGVVDPIAELSGLLESVDPMQKIGLHIDAALGGLILPWMQEAGFSPYNEFDFSVPRVTSISLHMHPFGRLKKGCAAILYRNEKWREHQIYVTTQWVGGVYCAPSLDERKAESDIAGTWALMVSLGRTGFVKETKKLLDCSRALAKRLKESPLFELLGDPKLMVIPFSLKDNTVSAKDIVVLMKERGWNLKLLGIPQSMQFTVTLQDAADPEFLNIFMRDLKQAFQKVKSSATPRGKALSCPYLGTSLEKLEARAFIPKNVRYPAGPTGKS